MELNNKILILCSSRVAEWERAVETTVKMTTTLLRTHQYPEALCTPCSTVLLKDCCVSVKVRVWKVSLNMTSEWRDLLLTLQGLEMMALEMIYFFLVTPPFTGSIYFHSFLIRWYFLPKFLWEWSHFSNIPLTVFNTACPTTSFSLSKWK